MSRGIPGKPCLLEDYIIPSLKTKKFGKLLEWEDEENGIFRVRWSHKSGSTWNKKYFSVFTTWDAVKGRTEEEEHYYTNSKGRFRSALHRLKSKIALLKSGDKKKYRRYQLKKYKENNENTTSKLKARKQKQNHFTDIKMHNNQDVPNMLNIQINNKQDDYNSLFSEVEYELLYLKVDEQLQLNPSGLSDSSSIFNSENDDYQPKVFVSENRGKILSDFDYFGVNYNSSYSNNDLFQLHGDIIFSEEEKTVNKENELTELKAMDFESFSTWEISGLVKYINSTEQ